MYIDLVENILRIKKEFKKSGFFWLPSNPEKKIPGILTILDGGKIELEVVGLFDDSADGYFNNKDDLKRIIGHIEKDGLVTLDDCFYRNKNFSFGGISKSLIHVHKVVSGVAYDKDEIISFNTFEFSIEGIDEWVGVSGIKVTYPEDMRSATITFVPPQELSFNLNNGMQLLIIFGWTLPGFSLTTEAKITQKTYFKLVSKDSRALDDFTSIAYRITTLLCFAIDQTVCLEQVTATSNEICREIANGKSRPVSISLYYPSLPFTEHEPKIDLHRMLFRYKEIQDNTEQIINNWLEAYDKINPTLNLYFSTKIGAHKYLEGKFLALAQGLETYHRRISDEKLMDELKFKTLIETILNQCPEEDRNWLSGRLIHGNEINLGRRIKSIIEPFKEIIGTNKERNKIIRSIVDTRNYLTHYDKSLHSKAAGGKELWELCLKMEAFFQLHFLQVLGFTEKEVKSVLDNSDQLKHKLNKVD